MSESARMEEEPGSPPGDSDQHVITKRSVFGWVVYDLANTIFQMGVISLLFPIYVREAVGPERADRVFGIIMAVSMGVIFLASPLLGAMTDRARRRMPFLGVSMAICAVLTCLMARFGFVASAVLFVVANIAFQASVQFYDALLPQVSTESNRGRIGGIGVGVGYVGSFLAVGLSLRPGTADKPLLFLLYGASFFALSIPCLIWVRERPNRNVRPINFEMVITSTRETIRALGSGKEFPGLLRFLIGRAFYTDAINTVILMMTLFTVNVAVASGLEEADGENRAKIIMLLAVVFAIAGGFVWGLVTDWLGPKRTLGIVLSVWMGIFVGAALVGILGLPLWTMYGVASLAGFSMGGVWAADRPLMLQLTPPHRVGEFYGLYGMVGRFSAIIGPVIWSGVTAAAFLIVAGSNPDPGREAEYARISQGIGVLVLLGLIVISRIILRKVPANR